MGQAALGAGGAEFAWWCTEDQQAFTGREPVYVSLEDELVAMVGRDVYDLLRAYLHSRTAPARQRVSLLAHPSVCARPKTADAGRKPA